MTTFRHSTLIQTHHTETSRFFHWCAVMTSWALDIYLGQFVRSSKLKYQKTETTTWLYCVVAHNTVFGSKLSAICAQAVYILHSTMPSVTYLRLTDVSVIGRVTYFQFPCWSARQHIGVLVYAVSDIGRCWKFELVSCTERTDQENDFPLILTVKWKLDIGYRDHFINLIMNFGRSASLHSYSGLKSQDVEIFPFFEKRPLIIKFSKSCFESFHRDTDRRCCVQIFWNLAKGKSCVIYLTKNFACLSNCRYCVDHAQNLPGSDPQQCTAPDFIQIGSLSAEL